jgi:succinyl-CoA synthetase beta subunit
MKIHEYQGKALLRRFDIPVPDGGVAFTVQDAEAVAARLKGPVRVVKAQIHAGGRGKGGGVKVARSLEEVHQYASQILGMNLVTHQTGPEGKVVKRLLIEDGCRIAKEYYFAVIIDRQLQRPIVMASSEGGMEIEVVAERSPEKILKEVVDPAVGLAPFQCRRLAFRLGMTGKTVHQAAKVFEKLYDAFVKLDCSLLEVNPLVVTEDGGVVVLDAKVNFDDNALYRHPEYAELRDLDEEDPAEIEASRFDLSYIKLNGTIGCMVNGAGLAMATMDIIKLYGGEPANFLDVGGGATTEKVTAAFKIITRDPHVKGILVNIFGGIMRCDIIANGILAAVREVGLKVPLVVRLQGTNVEQGKQILAESGLQVISADGMRDAAEKIVAAIGGAGGGK